MKSLSYLASLTVATSITMFTLAASPSGALARDDLASILRVDGGVVLACQELDEAGWSHARFYLENRRNSDVVRAILWEWTQGTGFDNWYWDKSAGTPWVRPGRRRGIAGMSSSDGEFESHLMKVKVVSREQGKHRTREVTWAELNRC